MAIPGAVGVYRGDGLGAIQPVAWANIRLRNVAGRPRQSVWRVDGRKSLDCDGDVCDDMPR
jgi:hypothetical protein